MDHDHFVGQVQHRAHLSSRGDAETAIRATLEILGQRLQPESAEHLAAQLPHEIGRHLHADHFEHLTLLEFYQRVAAAENVDVRKAIFHARAVIETLREAVSPGAVRKIRKQMPEEFGTLFMPVAA